MIKREFTAIYQKRGKWFVGWIEEVPGVNTQGKTKGEVRENLKEALELVLEANRRIAAETHRGATFREGIRIALPA